MNRHPYAPPPWVFFLAFVILAGTALGFFHTNPKSDAKALVALILGVIAFFQLYEVPAISKIRRAIRHERQDRTTRRFLAARAKTDPRWEKERMLARATDVLRAIKHALLASDPAQTADITTPALQSRLRAMVRDGSALSPGRTLDLGDAALRIVSLEDHPGTSSDGFRVEILDEPFRYPVTDTSLGAVPQEAGDDVPDDRQLALFLWGGRDWLLAEFENPARRDPENRT